LEEIRRRWEEVMGALNQSNRKLTAFQREARPVALAGGVLTLLFSQQFHHSQLATNDERKRAVTEAIARVVGRTVGVKCELAEEGAAPSRPAGPGQPKLLQDVLDTFPGSTVEG
jgi:hypothetical protein